MKRKVGHLETCKPYLKRRENTLKNYLVVQMDSNTQISSLFNLSHFNWRNMTEDENFGALLAQQYKNTTVQVKKDLTVIIWGWREYKLSLFQQNDRSYTNSNRRMKCLTLVGFKNTKWFNHWFREPLIIHFLSFCWTSLNVFLLLAISSSYTFFLSV